MKPEGPYGEVYILLKVKNTASNRKRIQTFWKRHSKNCDESPYLSDTQHKIPTSSVESEPQNQPKLTKRAENYLCIRGANNDNWEQNGDMAECEACHQWYHFQCICLKKLKDAKKLT